MITVDEALGLLFELVEDMPVQVVPLIEANGRVMAQSVSAKRNQPPFDASAMDGYALSDAAPGNRFRVMGESAAGKGFTGVIHKGEAVRIFTGAPVPEGADRIIIQEDVTRDGDTIQLNDNLDPQSYIRPAGVDFKLGDQMPAKRLGPSDIALLAAMNFAKVPVRKRPVVALVATGDELVMPGETPGPDQIIASNTFGLSALLHNAGAHPLLLPIARDNHASLVTAFDLAKEADLIVTIGGASVGDHDLVGSVAAKLGMDRSFYKIAMRPGKPLMAGRIHDTPMVGLPGNPVSSMVCGIVFLVPMILAMLGLGQSAAMRKRAPLITPLERNGPREHYMRAVQAEDGIRALDRQDSSLLSVLGAANALLIRPINDSARNTGDLVDYIAI